GPCVARTPRSDSPYLGARARTGPLTTAASVRSTSCGGSVSAMSHSIHRDARESRGRSLRAPLRRSDGWSGSWPKQSRRSSWIERRRQWSTDLYAPWRPSTASQSEVSEQRKAHVTGGDEHEMTIPGEEIGPPA